MRLLPVIVATILSSLASLASAAGSYGPTYGFESLPTGRKPSPNGEQIASWARGDSQAEIQDLIYKKSSLYCSSTVTDAECFNWTVDSYYEGCISADMWFLFRHNQYRADRNSGSVYFYYPECLPKKTFLQPCKCGCLIEGTKVLTWLNDEEKWERIEKLPELKAQLLTLASPFNGYNDFDRLPAEASYVASEDRNLERAVIEIKASLLDEPEAEIHSLVLTPSHPLLLVDGSFRAADEILPTDVLLSYEGREMKVVSIERKKYRGLVYNADVSSPSHVIFAEHLAIGDLYMQGVIDRERSRLAERRE